MSDDIHNDVVNALGDIAKANQREVFQLLAEKERLRKIIERAIEADIHGDVAEILREANDQR